MLREASTRNGTPSAMTDKPRSTIIEDNPIGNGGALRLPDSDCRCSHHIFATRSWITDNGEELLYHHLDFQGSFGFCFRQRRHFHRQSFTCPAVGFIYDVIELPLFPESARLSGARYQTLQNHARSRLLIIFCTMQLLCTHKMALLCEYHMKDR